MKTSLSWVIESKWIPFRSLNCRNKHFWQAGAVQCSSAHSLQSSFLRSYLGSPRAPAGKWFSIRLKRFIAFSVSLCCLLALIIFIQPLLLCSAETLIPMAVLIVTDYTILCTQHNERLVTDSITGREDGGKESIKVLHRNIYTLVLYFQACWCSSPVADEGMLIYKHTHLNVFVLWMFSFGRITWSLRKEPFERKDPSGFAKPWLNFDKTTTKHTKCLNFYTTLTQFNPTFKLDQQRPSSSNTNTGSAPF